ncbi:MAG: T9SS type A sorting domain-containing protein [Bacteroidota bacterium]|nr:T9SS type A sorting domain-containing protein [Bacteroidota bacterium]
MCGDTGTILKTTDGGGSWSFQNAGAANNLNGIYFTDLNTGVAVGDTGKILRTTNGGNNWQTITTALNTKLICIKFSDSRIGYINSITKTLRTTNGGLDWIIFNGGGIDLFFPDTLIGYSTGGSGIILKTLNGGMSWVTQSGNVAENLNSIFFINVENGYAVGNGGAVTKTTNGGINWTPQIKLSNNQFNSVYFINANTGYIAGDFGTLLKTTNGGLVFISSENNIHPEEFSLAQNYPNPFNSGTIIKYQIRTSADVKIIIYNIEGKEMIKIINEKQNAGNYEILFDASDLTAGVYLYSLLINNTISDTKKLILIK